MKKRIVCLFLTVLMVFSCVAVLASCGGDNTACTNHVDANHDGKCDTEGCSQTLTVVHKDNNGDGKCDACGATVEAEECEHEDEDLDGYCDICDEEVEMDVCEHYDDNGDGWCDECDEPMEDDTDDVIINYPWNSQSLIFQMTHNTNNNELPSACERYLAGEDDTVSDPIDNSVRNRNMLAEYTTKVSVRYEYYPDTAEYMWGANIQRIESTVQSQTTKDAPDMYCNFVYDLVGASLKRCFANLRTTSRGTGELRGLNYFEFNNEDYNEKEDNRGYMYEYMTSLTLSQHKMYILSSDYFTDMIRAFFCVPVSVTLLSDVGDKVTGDRNKDGEFTIDDFYEQVKAGEWTYDLLATYSDAVYKAADTNTSGGCQLSDETVGFAFSNGGLAASGLLYTTSVVIIHKDWNDDTNDWKYYYPADNNDLYKFCDATTALFQKPGICIVGKNYNSAWGDSSYEAIRTRFSQNHVLFGDVMLVGAFEFEEYQNLKESAGGFGIVPVPLYRANDEYLTQIHNMGRPGAIQVNTTKFVECSAFLNYQSTHSTDILNEYYDYKLQYDVADGTPGTVYMLQYIRTHVRSSFDKCFEDAIGSFYGTEASSQKWHTIMATSNFQLDLRKDYGGIYQSKKANLDGLTLMYQDLPE